MLDRLWPAWHGYDLFVIEFCLVLVAICISLNAPGFGERFFRASSRAFGAIARRPILSLMVIGMAPVVVRALSLQLTPLPVPYIHDEYSFLLASDTFAHGRLANRPHPLWMFFESMHILQQPTYASMYPPGQGAFLAIGQIFTRCPWIGVALSTGAMCSALLWMLRGWFSPRWAFLGASIVVMRIGVFSYWMSSYWGGSVAALGGALTAGSVARLWKRPRPIDGGLLGLGIVILATSRPFEGALFSIPFIAALLWKHACGRALVPLGSVLAIGTALMCYYNWRVTGDPFQLPQLLQRKQYAIYDYTILQASRPEPVYRHAVLRDFYVRTEATYRMAPDSIPGLVRIFLAREKVLFWFFLGPLLLMPVLLGARALVSRKLALLSASFLMLTVGHAFVAWPLHAHYYAPATCLIYSYLLQSMRYIRCFAWRGRRFGLFLVRSVPCVCVLMVVIRSMIGPLGLDVATWPMTWFNTTPGNTLRSTMLASVSSWPGKTLIIVRYAPQHNPENEWVYNEADIDRAKVVWAREMPSGNQQLLDYFPDRRTLLVEPDRAPGHLVPYSPPVADAK